MIMLFQKNSYVVEYEIKKGPKKEKLLSIADLHWIELEDEYVWLPPPQLLRKPSLYRQPPEVDKKKWTRYKCDKLVGPMDFYEALKKSKEMSGSEKEDEIVPNTSTEVRKRKAPSRFSPTLESKKRRISTSSDDSDNSISDKRSGTSTSSGSEDSESEMDKENQSEGNDSGSGGEEEEVVLAEGLGNLSSKKRKKKTPAKSPIRTFKRTKSKSDEFSDFQTTIAEERRETRDLIRALTVEVKDVNAKVDDFIEKPNRNRKDYRRYLPDFPLQSAQEFIDFEMKLKKKKKVKRAFVKRLEDIGGYNIANFVRNIFLEIMGSALIEMFSMTGKLTEKCPFEHTSMCKSMIEAVTSSTGTEAEVRKKIMIKLQHAKGDNKKAKKKELTIELMKTLLLGK